MADGCISDDQSQGKRSELLDGTSSAPGQGSPYKIPPQNKTHYPSRALRRNPAPESPNIKPIPSPGQGQPRHLDIPWTGTGVLSCKNGTFPTEMLPIGNDVCRTERAGPGPRRAHWHDRHNWSSKTLNAQKIIPPARSQLHHLSTALRGCLLAYCLKRGGSGWSVSLQVTKGFVAQLPKPREPAGLTC